MLRNEVMQILTQACLSGSLDGVATFVPNENIDINNTDNPTRSPLIFHAIGRGHMDVVKYLYEKCGAKLSSQPGFPSVLEAVVSCPAAKRKEMIAWLREDNRYLEIDQATTKYLLDAVEGIVPDFTKPDELTTIGDELGIIDLTMEKYLNIKDNHNTLAEYLIISGLDLVKDNLDKQIPIETIIKYIPNVEKFILRLLLDKKASLVEQLFKTNAFCDINLNRKIVIEIKGEIMRANVAYAFAWHNPLLLVKLYKDGYIARNNTIDLNIKLEYCNNPHANNKAVSVGYALTLHRKKEITELVIFMANKMKEKGQFVDVNIAPTNPQHGFYNFSLAYAFFNQNLIEELDSLMNGATHQFINFNKTPNSQAYAGVPFGVVFSTMHMSYFKSYLSRQLKLTVPPELSREEKIDMGWILDLNKQVDGGNDILNGSSMGWTIANYDAALLEEIMNSKPYIDEIINLNVYPIGLRTTPTIAWMLASKGRFKLLRTMIERDQENRYPIRLNATFSNPISTSTSSHKNQTYNVATMLAENNEFELLKMMAERNPTEMVELNPINNNELGGLGNYLLANHQFLLFKLFLARMPENYIFKLNPNSVSILLHHDIELLRNLIMRDPKGEFLDLAYRSPALGNDSLETSLEEIDKSLLELIRTRNKLHRETSKKSKGISLASKAKEIVSITNTNNEEKSPPKSNFATLKETVETLVTGKGISVDVKGINNNEDEKTPLVITFTANENNIAILKKVLKDYIAPKYFGKTDTKTNMTLTSSYSHFKGQLADEALRKKLAAMQTVVAKPKKAAANKTITSTSAPTTSASKETETPVVLDTTKQLEWKTQLAYAFCNAEEVRIEWDTDKNSFIAQLTAHNKACIVHSATAKHSNKGYYLTDTVIEGIIKTLRKELDGVAKVEIDLTTRKVTIKPKMLDILSLKRLQEINYNQITTCDSVIVHKDDHYRSDNKRQESSTPAAKSDHTASGQSQHKIRTAEVRSHLIDVLIAVLNDVNKDNKIMHQLTVDDFAFLENVKSDIVDECRFSISLTARPTVGVFATDTFIETIARHFNEKRTANETSNPDTFMQVTTDEQTKTISLTISKRNSLNDVFNAYSCQQLAEILKRMKANEKSRRENLIAVTADLTLKPEETEAQPLIPKGYNVVQKQFLIAFSRIKDKDLEEIQYHLDELKAVSPPSIEQVNDEIRHVVKDDDQVHYHLFLLHILRFMQILATKVKGENVFWNMRNNIFHAYKTLEWFEFYQKMNNIPQMFKELILAKKLSATSFPSSFFASKRNNPRFQEFESLLHKIEIKQGRKIDAASYDILIDMIHASNQFSYNQKRDFTMMIFALIGETTLKHPWRTVRDALGHLTVSVPYAEFASTIYNEFILLPKVKLESEMKQATDGKQENTKEEISEEQTIQTRLDFK